MLNLVRKGYRAAFPENFRYWIRNRILRVLSRFWVRFKGRRSTAPLEAHLQSIFHGLLKAGDCYVDVGANVGRLVIPAAKIVGSNGKVFAFEPVKKNLAMMRRNLSRNALTAEIHIEPVAVAEKAGSTTVYLNVRDGWHTIIKGVNSSGGSYLGTTQIPTISLDAYMAEKNIRRIEMLKIDVEGAELQVLQGAETLLRAQAIDTLIVELGNPHEPALVGQGQLVADLFLRNDYVMWVIEPQFLAPWRLEHFYWRQDILAMPRNREDDILQRLHLSGLQISRILTAEIVSTLKSRSRVKVA
jgi:FkbM family methyltransferase